MNRYTTFRTASEHEPSIKPSHTHDGPAFELKACVLPIMVLHIKDANPHKLYPQLEKKIGQARAFVNNAPVLIDLGEVDETAQHTLDFIFFADFLRRHGMVPVGVRCNAESLNDRVRAAGLGLMPAVRPKKSVPVFEENQHADTEEPTEKPAPASAAAEKQTPAPTTAANVPKAQPATAVPAMVITHPVRSGQQVIAPQGDLIVLSSVNVGAEVLAAGNIHVYGILRGRARAGINGDVAARIFSLQFDPELVAVAGEYMVSELLDKSLINESVLITLKKENLAFEVIGTFRPHA